MVIMELLYRGETALFNLPSWTSAVSACQAALFPPESALEDGMKCIYEIRFEVQWETSGPVHWDSQTVHVCSEEDAQEAIDNARKAALAQHRINDNGHEEH